MFMYCNHYRYIQVYIGSAKGTFKEWKTRGYPKLQATHVVRHEVHHFAEPSSERDTSGKKTLRSMRRNMKKSTDFDSTLIHLPRYVLTRAASNFGGLLASQVLTGVLAQCLVEVRRMVAFDIIGCHTRFLAFKVLVWVYHDGVKTMIYGFPARWVFCERPRLLHTAWCQARRSAIGA